MPREMYKITLICQNGNNGWSESIYYNALDNNDAFSPGGLQYAYARQQMMSSPARCTYLKIKLDSTARASSLTGIGTNTIYPLPQGQFVSGADRPEAACLYNLYSTDTLLQRGIDFRGLPDNVWDQATPANPDAQQFDTVVEEILKPLLINGNYYIKSRAFPLTPPAKVDMIDWVNVSGTLNSLITAFSVTGISPGDRIVINSAKGVQPNPGIVRVLGVDQVLKTIKVPFSLPNNYVFQAGPTFYKYSPVFGAIRSVNFDKFANRKTGRVFGVSRGRRKSIPR